jgi:hypothetical protein
MRPDETFGRALESLAENGLAMIDDRFGTAAVDDFGREQADAADDEPGLLKAAAQAGHFRLRSAYGRGSSASGPATRLLALTAPGGQVRRVQAFAAQQGADGTLAAAGLGLLDDGELVLDGELPPLRLGRNFRASPAAPLACHRGFPKCTCRKIV